MPHTRTQYSAALELWRGENSAARALDAAATADYEQTLAALLDAAADGKLAFLDDERRKRCRR